MLYYNVKHQYPSWVDYFATEYLCPWQVDEDEIVWVWDWPDLVKGPDWYSNVVIRAYQAHEEKRHPSRSGDCELANIMDSLTRKFATGDWQAKPLTHLSQIVEACGCQGGA